MKQVHELPRYQQIALDIAGKIVSGNYQEGDKIFARSALAVKYQVSPETSRRAMALLADLEIISVVRGSGCVVKSIEKAIQFRRRSADSVSLNTLCRHLNEQIDKQIAVLASIKEAAGTLVEQVEKYQHNDLLYPMHMKITKSCLYLGKSIKELSIWKRTGATIAAVNRKGQFIISPGPYAVIEPDDEIYFIGEEECWQRLYAFLYGTEDTAVLPAVHKGRTMDFFIRPYHKGEEQYVADAHRRLYAGEYGWGPAFTEYAAAIALNFAAENRQDNEELWIAEKEGLLAGSIMLCHGDEPDTGQLRLFLVEPSHRRSGIGSALLRTVLETARNGGYKRLILWTASPLTEAMRLYERAGFRTADEVENRTWRPDGKSIYEIKMIKEDL